MSLDNNKADAEEAVSELQVAILKAINVLEELDGCIDDAESLENLELHWAEGRPPDIMNFLNSLGLSHAVFTVEEIIS